MRPLITILSRKGSKSLPNKHLLPFCGKPLIQWTIEQAIEWGCADVIVCSDSDEVRKLARHLGVMAISRKAEYANDTAGKVAALRSCIDYDIPNAGMHDCIIDLDITNPCRHLEDIEKCLQLFEQKRPKTLFSVVKAKKNPYFNQVLLNGVGAPELVKDFLVSYSFGRINRRQDANRIYDINSNIYIYDAGWLRDENNNSVITDNSEIYIMPDWTFCDIDNQNDFDVAHFLFAKHILKEGYVQFEGKKRSGCGGHGPDWFGHRPCPTQAIGVCIND